MRFDDSGKSFRGDASPLKRGKTKASNRRVPTGLEFGNPFEIKKARSNSALDFPFEEQVFWRQIKC